VKKTILAALLTAYSLFGITTVFADVDDLLQQYETGDREFEKFEIGSMIVFWHQRMIGEAVVEKNQIVYQFNKTTEELLDKKIHWRDDLPETITVNVLEEEAEAAAGGEPLFSRLYIISPESDVFKLAPVPENACWVVRTIKDDEELVVIIDAVTGHFLGYGIPPPYESFSFSGPQYDYPCAGVWDNWYENAESWFNTMGYSCDTEEWPVLAEVQSSIQNNSTGMFYELAHGGSDYFASGCSGGSVYEYTHASYIESWIAGYPEMRFAFIGSCGGMCNTGDGSFSYEFRKGLNSYTVTVGYCGMAENYCNLCWSYSIDWQDRLFYCMNQGWTVKDAFDQALADYPACAGSNDCMRFAGDENFAGPYDRLYNPNQIPTLSEWGMIVLALLVLAVGTMAVIRRRRAVATE